MCVSPYDLCVLRREGDLSRWEVAVCHYGRREPLGDFATFEEAAEFALMHCDNARRRDNIELNVHFPDDCPCCSVTRQFVSLSI